MKFKTFGLRKDLVYRLKKQATTGQKISANHKSDKDLYVDLNS